MHHSAHVDKDVAEKPEVEEVKDHKKVSSKAEDEVRVQLLETEL